MMTRHKLSLVVVVLAVAALASTPILGAVFSTPVLEALEDAAVIGQTTELAVTVDEVLVGGTGLLYAQQPNGQHFRFGSFVLTDSTFVLDAPVPSTATAGESLTYYFRCAVDSGLTLVSTGATVFLKAATEGDEPPIWD